MKGIRFKSVKRRVFSSANEVEAARTLTFATIRLPLKGGLLHSAAVLCELTSASEWKEFRENRKQLRCCNWIRLPRCQFSSFSRVKAGRRTAIPKPELGNPRKPGARIFPQLALIRRSNQTGALKRWLRCIGGKPSSHIKKNERSGWHGRDV